MILSSPAMGISPPSFMRDIKYAGQSEGGTVLECPFTPRRSIFWGFNWRSSNPFGGYDNGANKMGFMMTTGPGAGGAWGMHYYGATQGSRVISIFLQGVDANNCHLPNVQGECNGNSMVFLPNINGSAVAEGVEHRIEVTMIRSATNTSRDGVLRVMIDGILRTYHTNVNFPAYDFISVLDNHTWDRQCAQRNPAVGPTTPPNDCRTFDDWHDWGDWYVSSGSGGSVTPPPPPPTDTTPPGQVTSVTVTQLN